MSIQKKNDIELTKSIERVLNLGIGASIEIQGSLYIRDIDNGEICVGGSYGPHMKSFVMPKENEIWPTWEEIFENIGEAIAFFLKYRNDNKLGCDFELLSDD